MAERIPEYTAPNLDLRPTNAPEAAFQLAARQSSRFAAEKAAGFSEAGQELRAFGREVEQYATQHETLAGVNDGVDIALQGIQSLHKIGRDADPFDPNAIRDHLQQTFKQIDEWAQSDKFTTPGSQKFAAEQAKTLKLELFHQGMAIDQERAKAVADTGLEQIATKLGNIAAQPGGLLTAVNMIPMQLKTIISQIPNASPAEMAKMQTTMEQKLYKHVYTSAFNALAELGKPDAITAMWKEEYGKYIEKEPFIEKATRRAEENLRIQNLGQVMQDRTDKLDFNAALNREYARIQITPNGAVIPPDFFTNIQKLSQTRGGAVVGDSAIKSALALGDELAKEQRSGVRDTTDPLIRDDFANRLTDSSKPLTVEEVNQAKIGHTLSDADWHLFRTAAEWHAKQAAENPVIVRNQEFAFTTARNQINPKGALGIPNPTAEAATRHWNTAASFTYLQMLTSGAEPQKAIDYVTSDQFLKPYIAEAQGTNAGAVLDQTNQNVQPQAAPKPGEKRPSAKEFMFGR